MANNKVFNPLSIDNRDIANPTSAQKYPLGMEVCIQDEASGDVTKYIYLKAASALVAGQPYSIVEDDGTAGEITTASFITLASAIVLVGVPQVAFTTAYYGFVAIQGTVNAKVAGATTAGHRLEVFTSGSAFTTEAAATLSINSAGMAITTVTGADTTAVMLAGRRVEVQAT